MKAINRTNRLNLVFCFVELTNGQTRIHLRGNGKDKSIIVNAGIELLDQAWFNWQNGAYVQDAFPFMNANEREFIMTGITETEWDELFGERE